MTSDQENNGTLFSLISKLKETMCPYFLDVIRYKSKALLELANKMEDDKCGEKVALLQKIVLQEGCPEEVKSQYEIWKQQNDSVYYQNVLTDKDVEVISLEEAFGILSKCFEIPLK